MIGGRCRLRNLGPPEKKTWTMACLFSGHRPWFFSLSSQWLPGIRWVRWYSPVLLQIGRQISHLLCCLITLHTRNLYTCRSILLRTLTCLELRKMTGLSKESFSRKGFFEVYEVYIEWCFPFYTLFDDVFQWKILVHATSASPESCLLLPQGRIQFLVNYVLRRSLYHVLRAVLCLSYCRSSQCHLFCQLYN